MNPVLIIQILEALAPLVSEAAPLIEETVTAIRGGDEAALEALLAKLQASNDQLGQA